MLQVARGTATLIKKDIFKNLMWYVLPDSTKQFPLTIERVRKIRSLNHQNIIPDELEAVEVVSHVYSVCYNLRCCNHRCSYIRSVCPCRSFRNPYAEFLIVK